MLSYKINEFIELKLRHGKTYIYINGKEFLMCIRLAFQTPEQDTQEFEGINSSNETIEKYDDYISDNKVKRNFNHQKPIKNKYMITPAQEFHAICSNIEAWVENNYDKRILLGSITLSLLKELIKAGEPLAKRRFQEEIATRLECAKPSVIQYLSKGDSLSLDYFSKEELQSIFSQIIIISHQREIIEKIPHYYKLNQGKIIEKAIP